MPFDNLESQKQQPKDLVQYISEEIVAKMGECFHNTETPEGSQIRINLAGNTVVFWDRDVSKLSGF